jgi:hypothetical protein
MEFEDSRGLVRFIYIIGEGTISKLIFYIIYKFLGSFKLYNSI